MFARLSELCFEGEPVPPFRMTSYAGLLCCRASCLSKRMGIGFSVGGTFARPGPEGFRPAFLSLARTGFLSRQTAANEINHLAVAGTTLL